MCACCSGHSLGSIMKLFRCFGSAHRGNGGKKTSGGGGGGGGGGGVGGGGGGVSTPPPQLRGRGGRGGGKEELQTKKQTATTTITTPSLVTPAGRTRSASRGSAGASPRVPHKPGSVAPAPPRPTSRPGSLNRFGFRSGGGVKAGDSTDSVNSILSDAQTTTDSTPDLCDLCDLENGNVTSASTSKQPPVSAGQQEQQIKQSKQSQGKQQEKSHPSPKLANSRLGSPASRSTHLGTNTQTSATSSPAAPGRLTATTRQLPKPQVPTVKSFPNSKNPQPQVTQIFVDPIRGRAFSSGPRVSRDSESSSRSTTEADSGLGSSSESDRLAREELGDTDTLDSTNLEFPEDVSELWLREKRSVLDAGRGGTTHLAPHSTLELAFRGSGSIEVKRRGLEVKVTATPPQTMPSKSAGVGAGVGMGGGMTASSSVLGSPPERKGKGGKEKRESPITYGMARQKFAPYSRNRFGYYHSSYQTRNTDTPTTTTTTPKLSMATPTTTTTSTGKLNGANGKLNSTSPPKTSPTNLKTQRSPPSQLKTSPPLPQSTRTPPQSTRSSPPSRSPPNAKTSPQIAGLVKSRVALLETTPNPSVKKVTMMPPSLKKPALKKPLVRPTSLEKSPSLLMPVSERNIELSKPVFRKLEYCETFKDSVANPNKNIAEDILIVGSVETETLTDDLKLTRAAENERMAKGSPNGDLVPSEVTKGSKDAKEREKVILETSMTSATSDLSPDGSKVITPQSESSFEILESLSEADLTLGDGKKSDDMDESMSSTSSSHTHTHTHTQLLPSLKSPQDSTESPTEAHPHPPHPPAALTNSSSGPSGTCTPIMISARDLDLDFLIDDEIADQPGLTFGDDATGTGLPTFFGDDEFDELVAAVAGAAAGVSGTVPSPSHPHQGHLLHGSPGGGSTAGSGVGGEGCRRPRTDSIDTTTSSLAGDDLMLDFEASHLHPCMCSSTHSDHARTAHNPTTAGVSAGARPKHTHLRIALPGRRYDEEVMSPDASEIFSEWTAMMAEMSNPERCSSRDGSSGSGRIPRPRQGSLTEGTPPSDPRRPMVLRPPRQGSVSESEGSCGSTGSVAGHTGSGGVYLDRTTYHYMYQDVTALKTMLLRLRRMLQAADTINPFDANLRNSLYLSLASSESPGLNGEKDAVTPAQVSQENVDLRRQVVLLQQQLEDKDRTIRLLQQQLSQTLSLHHSTTTATTTTTTTTPPHTSTTATTTATTATVNAATQTERLVRAPLTGSSLSRAASIDDGLGPTVSSEERNERGRLRTTSTPSQIPHPARATSQPPPPLRPRTTSHR